MVKTYPSKNRDQMKIAIVEEVHDWKLLKDELEISKADKKMRMLYAHLLMYDMKMQELNSDSGSIDKPTLMKDLNSKKDKNFVYF